MKRKWNLLVNIGLVCLCLCAIVVGVYSAKNASLSVGGTVGFTANDCKVTIEAEMSGASSTADKYTDAGNKKSTITIDGATKTSESWKIDTVYFDDYYNTTPYKPVADIVFTFKVTNNSNFYIDATVNEEFRTQAEAKSIYVYAPNLGETLAPTSQEGSSCTFTIKLQLQRQADGTFPSTIDALNLTNSAPIMTFTKCDKPAYLADNWQDVITTTFDIKPITRTTTSPSEPTYEAAGIKGATKVSFVRALNETMLEGFEKENGTYKYAIVGANYVGGTAVTSESGYRNVSPVYAYYKSNPKELIVYSLARIYVNKCTYLFNNFQEVTDIKLDNFDTSNVTDMYGMFEGRYNYTPEPMALTTLDVSTLDTSKVARMTEMFLSCSNLTSLDVRNFNTESLTNVNAMFWYLTKAESIDVSNFNTSKITDFTNMFSNCENLTSLDLTSFDVSNASKLTTVFRGCKKIKTIYTNTNWVLKEGATSTNMFNDCTLLKGGNNTAYSASNVTATYACIDGEYGQVGYFTRRDY